MREKEELIENNSNREIVLNIDEYAFTKILNVVAERDEDDEDDDEFSDLLSEIYWRVINNFSDSYEDADVVRISSSFNITNWELVAFCHALLGAINYEDNEKKLVCNNQQWLNALEEAYDGDDDIDLVKGEINEGNATTFSWDINNGVMKDIAEMIYGDEKIIDFMVKQYIKAINDYCDTNNIDIYEVTKVRLSCPFPAQGHSFSVFDKVDFFCLALTTLLNDSKHPGTIVIQTKKYTDKLAWKRNLEESNQYSNVSVEIDEIPSLKSLVCQSVASSLTKKLAQGAVFSADFFTEHLDKLAIDLQISILFLIREVLNNYQRKSFLLMGNIYEVDKKLNDLEAILLSTTLNNNAGDEANQDSSSLSSNSTEEQQRGKRKASELETDENKNEESINKKGKTTSSSSFVGGFFAEHSREELRQRRINHFKNLGLCDDTGGISPEKHSI